MQASQPKVLNFVSLAMLSLIGIVNLRNLPIMASVGLHAIFFYSLAALCFLIPSSLVCAELASTWPQAGGVYLWVKKAFGEKIGFFAIWSEWFNNLFGFPASLSFIAATLGYIFIPHLSQHKNLLCLLMLIIIWGCTLFNFLGIKASNRLNILGAIAGTIIPSLVIIGLGSFWYASGHPIQITFSIHNLIPKGQITSLVLFLGVISGYMGMQISAFHAPNVANPSKDYPKSIFLAVLMIVAITMLASLAIALVVPAQKLSLVSGVIEGFVGFLAPFHLRWAVPLLALLIAMSGIATLSAWLLAPARGLATAASAGNFPTWMGRENNKGMPTNILLLQAIIATGLILLFLFTDSINTTFWILVVLTSQFAAVLHILIFGAALKLRYKEKSIIRPFKVPGNIFSLWIICAISIITCLIGITLGFFPPNNLHINNIWRYETIIISSNFLYLLLPFILYKLAKKPIIS